MQPNKLKLEVISPEGIIYSGDADELIVESSEGQLAILPSHAPLFTRLSEGEAIVRTGGTEITLAVAGGFLEVRDNAVSILADFAIKAEDIAVNAVEKARKQAEEAVKNKDIRNAATSNAELRRTLLELKVADRFRKKSRRT